MSSSPCHRKTKEFLSGKFSLLLEVTGGPLGHLPLRFAVISTAVGDL